MKYVISKGGKETERGAIYKVVNHNDTTALLKDEFVNTVHFELAEAIENLIEIDEDTYNLLYDLICNENYDHEKVQEIVSRYI